MSAATAGGPLRFDCGIDGCTYAIVDWSDDVIGFLQGVEEHERLHERSRGRVVAVIGDRRLADDVVPEVAEQPMRGLWLALLLAGGFWLTVLGAVLGLESRHLDGQRLIAGPLLVAAGGACWWLLLRGLRRADA